VETPETATVLRDLVTAADEITHLLMLTVVYILAMSKYSIDFGCSSKNDQAPSVLM